LHFRKNHAEPAENNPAPTDEQNPPRLDRRRSGEPSQLDPTLGLPGDTPISDVELPARIRNALVAAGLETVGEVRDPPRRRAASAAGASLRVGACGMPADV
jgi:hypothetical protein